MSVRWLWLACCALLYGSGCDAYDPSGSRHGVYDSCCSGEGTCVPAGLLDATLAGRLARAGCERDLLCAPRALAADRDAILPACHGAYGLEGRCLPSCLPEVAKAADRLERGECGAHALCLPCFDPLSGDDTGACRLGGDPGPREAARTFASCCDGRGRCIPRSGIDETDRERLAADSCSPESDALCVPSGWLADEPLPPPRCHTSASNAEGRCLPGCLPDVAALADQLAAGSCAPDLLCVPCFDPRDGRDTKACSGPGDAGPSESPALFASCCGGLGRCVPEASVPGRDRERLASDDCAGDGELCAPSEWLADERAPALRCRAVGGREGRCLPACLPEVAAQSERLERGSCGALRLCVPCFDPLSGEDTGACRVAPDPGPAEPARPFSDCCGGLGRCVPVSLIEEDDRPRLATDSCDPAALELCAPSAWLGAEPSAPHSCRAPGDLEGRCLPACLPDVAAQAAQLTRANCAEHELCSPCFDPLTGADTQACRGPGDAGPREGPKTFEHCCGELGRCLPRSVVDEAARASLGRDSCHGEGDVLCVPSDFIAAAAPASCRAPGDLEGRCLPRCLPQVAALGDRLQQGDCAADHACVPCFDPLSGAATSACSGALDPGPVEPARRFAECCDGVGRCVPGSLIPDAGRDRLASDTCDAEAGERCAPSAWLDPEPSAPRSCRAPGDLEGRCLPACLPDVAAQAAQLTQANCAEHELCSPCFDPLTGADTQACRGPGDAGPQEGPKTFEHCCGELGRCLPRSTLDEATAPSFDRNSCHGEGDVLCVPSDFIAAVAPASCRAPGDLEARCLPRCLPQVAALAGRVQQGDCSADRACVPCFDPLSGASTGACALPGDGGAVEAPKTYATCCPDGERTLGTCLPLSLLPAGLAASLPAGLCADGFACVPDALVRTPDVGLAACGAPLLGIGPPQPGACVPRCLIAQGSGTLSQASCAAAERCVPCSSLPLETPACE